ncbi:hypothetical protein [Pseudomonas batumici]|uniref:hypothetical protein n=1 Tax=Pseudomonas batumici TaxID=226910 RepID=UPI00058A4DBE|nr:hypothetical protein [Pseudomonas batumici]
MLISIEEADTNAGWLVVMDAWRVKFRSYAEAEAFVEKLKDRINAPHPLPISINRPVAEPS